MSRLVSAIVPPEGGFTPLSARAADTDGYLGRVAKYVPAEIVALYLPLVKFIDAAGKLEARSVRLSLLALSFLVFLVLTPIYFTKTARPGDAVKAQRIVSSIAFVCWAYSLGGVFTELGIENNLVSGFLLIIFTAISGTIKSSK
jgi:uncharacterized membrane protein